MKPLISFCSQCKGRRIHIEKTLLHNLQCIEKIDSSLEYILLDFDSNDGLSKWVVKKCYQYIESSILKLYRVENQPYYLQSAVKNLSHRLSTGINIINIDADNLISEEYVKEAIEVFNQNPNTLLLAETSAEKNFTIFGRIGMPRHIFNYVKGYDEVFTFWGGEDFDILTRLDNLTPTFLLKRHLVPESKIGSAIEHNNHLRFVNYPNHIFKNENNTILTSKKLLTADEQQIIFHEPNEQYIVDSRDYKLIFSRLSGTKFVVQKWSNGKFIDIGNI